MGKKVLVEIEYTRLIESEIELPEGKTLDDIHHCISGGGNDPKVDIWFSDNPCIHLRGVDPRTKIPDIKIREKDYEERCNYIKGGTTFVDLETKERVTFC